MENNKAYLKKIHWVFLIGFVSVLLEIFLKKWFESVSSGRTAYIILYSISFSCLYASLGIATSKWKETAIAWGIEVLIYYAFQLFLFDEESLYNVYIRFVYFILYSFPIVVFFALQYGWTKKLISIYFACIALSCVSSLSFYAHEAIKTAVRSFRDYPDAGMNFFIGLSKTAGTVFTIICLCELNNFMLGKKDTWKTALLNPGNEYSKLNSLITFWMMKVMLLIIVAGAGYYIYNYLGSITNTYRLTNGNTIQLRQYYHIIGIIYILSFVATTLMFVWYLRKFLLEYFISYNISSKFLYWISLFPFIGSFVFAILQLHDTKQGVYEEKVHTIGNFAASSSTAITTIFIIIYFLRLIFRIEGGNGIFIASIIASFLLFFWFISDRTGYYVILGLTMLVLAGLLVVIFIGHWETPVIPLAFSLFLFNIIQLVLTFPVYHFEEFEYITAENPGYEDANNSLGAVNP